MRRDLVNWLACPACGGAPLSLQADRVTTHTAYHAHLASGEACAGVDPETHVAEDVLEGSLTCGGCGRVYPVSNGIPRMLLDPEARPPQSAHAWTTFERAQREWETTFQDFMDPLGPDDFLGRLTLDAGCGYGRHACFAARYGAEVIAMDWSGDAVDATRRNTRDLFRVHVVQGDIHHPPFPEGTFDLVYCLGVLHHLDQPREVFRGLSSLLVQGGRLSTWVYGPRQGVAAAVTRSLRSATTRLSPENLHSLSRGVALGLRVFSHTPYRLLHGVPGGRAVVSHLPVHDHHRWPMDVVVADVYDRLRIPVTLTLTGEDLERWYEEEGYAAISVTRRVRNNETFRGTGVRR